MDRRRTLLEAVGVVLGLLGAGTVGLLVLWVLPEVLTRPQGDLSAAERLKAANDVRTSSIAFLVAIGAVVTLAFTVRTFVMNRRGQVTDRYSTAVGQLSDTFAPVKIGAIHALGSVASDSKRERDTVIQVLGAFIRLRSHEFRAGGQDEIDEDVQTALDVVARLLRRSLQKVDLRGADLRNARLDEIPAGRALTDGADIRIQPASDRRSPKARRLGRTETRMALETTTALDPIGRFITAAKKAAGVTALDEGRFANASAAMSQVAGRLLDANSHMAGWLIRFTNLRFGSAQSTKNYSDLVDDWIKAKAGAELHKLKFRCRELFAIYKKRINPDLASIFPDDAAIRDEVDQAFESLRGTDDDMVDFIYHELVDTIDTYVEDVKGHIARSRPNDAERCRLAFDRDTAQFLERLVRFGGELSDLVLLYADKAGIDVIDEGNSKGP